MENFTWYTDTLSRVEKILYKQSFEFELQHGSGADEDSAHFAGMQKVNSVRALAKEMEKPQTYVDLKTGKRFTCTEAEMMARHQF